MRIIAFLAAAAATATSLFGWTRESARDIYDIPLPAPAPGADVLRINLGSAKSRLAPGRLVKAFVVHLKSGGTWLQAGEIPAEKNGAAVYIPLEAVKGGSGLNPSAFSAVRVSAWGALGTAAAKAKKLPPSGAPAARFVKPSVGVVANGFSRERIRERLNAPLRFFDENDIAGLRKFAAQGGKIAVANCGNRRLAEFMGVEVDGWRRIDSTALVSPSGKVLCKYECGGAHVPSVPRGANPLHARVVAKMYDSAMRDTGAAGAVATDRGVWYANAVPPPSIKPGAALPPRKTRIRGVWTNGAPLDPAGWSGMAARLSAAGFNAVFIRSDSPFFQSALTECRKRGIAVHAWLTAFEGGKRSALSAKDREAVRAEAAALFKAGVDGVQLDYFRFPAGSLKSAQEKAEGSKLLTGFLAAISRDAAAAGRRRGRRIALSVAVLPAHSSQAGAGQDVQTWLGRKLADFVSPMCYTQSSRVFATQVLANGNAAKTVAGIGSGANESRLDAAALNTQMRIAEKAGLAGFAVFRLDAELAARLPPAPRR